MSSTCMTVCFSGDRNDLPLVFVAAWRKFIERHKKELPFDVVFIHGGFDETKFNAAVGGVVPTYSLPGWDKSFGVVYPSMVYASGYKYVLHIDHDAFPSIAMLRAVNDLLDEHGEIDFMGPTNFPRSVNIQGSDLTRTKYCSKKIINGKLTISHFPFGIPSDDGDFWVMKRDLFFDAQALMLANLKSKYGDVRQVNQIINHTLTYGETCNILGASSEEIPTGVSQDRLWLDGAFQGDLWVWICSQRPQGAGILSPSGISFRKKNHLRDAFSTIHPVKWSELVDTDDASFPYKLNAYNDELFHLQSGYISWWYLQPMIGNQPDPYCSLFQHFRPPFEFFYCQHFAAVYLLAQHNMPDLARQMEVSMGKLLEHKGVDQQEFWRKIALVQAYSAEPLKEYI